MNTRIVTHRAPMTDKILGYPLVWVTQGIGESQRDVPLLPHYSGDFPNEVDFALGYQADGCQWICTDFEGWGSGAPVNIDKSPRLGGDGGFPLGRPSHPGRTFNLSGTVIGDSRQAILQAADRVAAHMADQNERGAFPGGTRVHVQQDPLEGPRWLPIVADGGVQLRWLSGDAFEFQVPWKTDDFRSYGLRGMGNYFEAEGVNNESTPAGGAQWNLAIPQNEGTAPVYPQIVIKWTDTGPDPDADMRLCVGGYGAEHTVATLAAGFMRQVDSGAVIRVDSRQRRVMIKPDDDPLTPVTDARGLVTFPAAGWEGLAIPAQEEWDFRVGTNAVPDGHLQVKVYSWAGYA